MRGLAVVLTLLLIACGATPDEFDRLRALPAKTDWDLQQDLNIGKTPSGHYLIKRMVVIPCRPYTRFGSALFEITEKAVSGDFPVGSGFALGICMNKDQFRIFEGGDFLDDAASSNEVRM